MFEIKRKEKREKRKEERGKGKEGAASLYRPVAIGLLELEGNLFLAPTAGYTDRGFRSLCVGQGANFTFTELVSAEALYRNPGHYGLGNDAKAASPAAVSLVSRASNERRYAVQLFAGEPEAFYRAALALAPLRPDVVDINCGCPVPKVVKNGAGSALMKDPARLGRIVEATGRASREALGGVPVTVKMRSGWDSASINYAECARIAVEAGAAMISLHPRTRSQDYGGTSDWSCIADLVSRLAVPVTGSGDLYTPEDARRMLGETGCAAVMFARGAMGNPFIFSATRSLLETGAWEPAPFSDRMAAAFRHLELLAADIGERTACLEMRKQFCAYTKGLAGGAAVREQAVRAQSIEDYRRIIETFGIAYLNDNALS
ncbi:MAG: tRNA dihydrouridine synthase DusB [Treponema sp.]|jgi:nifR3 family TIM-barrel protein|nr:tRNA dihydrouridine synthase DusB [Treponema sp.]